MLKCRRYYDICFLDFQILHLLVLHLLVLHLLVLFGGFAAVIDIANA